MLIGYGVIFIGLFISLGIEYSGGDSNDPLIFALGFTPFAVGILLVTFWVRCPRCGGNLGTVNAGRFAFSRSARMNFCPFCGVSVDEPGSKKL
jgi:hypothetical protein